MTVQAGYWHSFWPDSNDRQAERRPVAGCQDQRGKLGGVGLQCGPVSWAEDEDDDDK